MSIGWGGAMGPAQFIPSTWVSYENRVAKTLGKQYANPWEPLDAFVASAIYLKDLGAAGGGLSAEKIAAAKYFAGGNWESLGMGYARQVLDKAYEYQKLIDIISN